MTDLPTGHELRLGSDLHHRWWVPHHRSQFHGSDEVAGMTTIEHALPIPVLYDDVLNLYALSGTGSTPTHIVNYGGVMGEQLIWATEDIPNNEK